MSIMSVPMVILWLLVEADEAIAHKLTVSIHMIAGSHKKWEDSQMEASLQCFIWSSLYACIIAWKEARNCFGHTSFSFALGLLLLHKSKRKEFVLRCIWCICRVNNSQRFLFARNHMNDTLFYSSNQMQRGTACKVKIYETCSWRTLLLTPVCNLFMNVM